MFDGKSSHYAIGDVMEVARFKATSPLRPRFRLRGGFLPTAHDLGNPCVRVKHNVRVWYVCEVAATLARPPAEPVFSEGPPSLRRDVLRLRFFLRYGYQVSPVDSGGRLTRIAQLFFPRITLLKF